MATRFSSIPEIPLTDLADPKSLTLQAMKQNIDLLIGARGEQDLGSRALTKGQITVTRPPGQNATRLTAQGAGFSLESGQTVPSAQDYARLLTDVQTLMNDVATLRATVDTLIQQLRS